MIVRHPNQRVVVLVDVQNLYYSARNLYQARVNFKNLLDVAVQGRILTRAIAYVIKADDSDKQEFFDAVNAAGFETKEKDLQIFFSGAKKGDWDIGIAMDAIRLGHKVDSIILVSGDGDFVPVVNYLQQSVGCLVEVLAFKQTANHDLIAMADDFIMIEDRKESLLFTTAKSKAVIKKEPQTPPSPPAHKQEEKSLVVPIITQQSIVSVDSLPQQSTLTPVAPLPLPDVMKPMQRASQRSALPTARMVTDTQRPPIRPIPQTAQQRAQASQQGTGESRGQQQTSQQQRTSMQRPSQRPQQASSRSNSSSRSQGTQQSVIPRGALIEHNEPIQTPKAKLPFLDKILGKK